MSEERKPPSKPPRDPGIEPERLASYHRFTRERGVSWPLYLLVRAILQPAMLIYFRLRRIGREHAKVKGPLIVAANHRSFLDPFVIAVCLPWRRPLHFVAKVELFETALAGLAAEPARRLPGAPRPGRRGGPDHLARGARARRRRLHLPRGDADPLRARWAARAAASAASRWRPAPPSCP